MHFSMLLYRDVFFSKNTEWNYYFIICIAVISVICHIGALGWKTAIKCQSVAVNHLSFIWRIMLSQCQLWFFQVGGCTCFSSSLCCCWLVAQHRCDRLANSTPFTNTQTYLLTSMLIACWLKMNCRHNAKCGKTNSPRNINSNPGMT